MRARLGLAIVCAVTFALPAVAHHSHGAYVEALTDLEGAVKEIHLLSPHSWVYLDVKNPSGELETWALEATGRNGLMEIGVSVGYIKPGDTIKARCHVLRDGSRGCLLGFIKARDGSVKDWDGGKNTPVPADF